MTNRQDQWIKARIAIGKYGSDSECRRDLTRRDREHNTRSRALKEAIEEGLASGAGNKTATQIWAEAEQRYRARHG